MLGRKSEKVEDFFYFFSTYISNVATDNHNKHTSVPLNMETLSFFHKIFGWKKNNENINVEVSTYII